MDENAPSLFGMPLSSVTPPETKNPERTEQPVLARGSGQITDVPQRTEHSIMEGLPEAKAERVAAMRRELADLQRQLIDAQQRIATELQGRAEDAERFEALEARLQAQELKSQQDAARAAELEIEVIGLRSQATSATAISDALHSEIAARDAKLEESSRLQKDLAEQLEAQSASLREAKTLLETRTTELATRTTERDAELANVARLEGELEEQRKQYRDQTEQLEQQLGALRDAKALGETREAALAAATAERDARTSELEQARRDLDAHRGKANEIAQQLLRFGQQLGNGDVSAVNVVPRPDVVVPEPAPVVEPPRVERQAPPPIPVKVAPIETILEVTEEPKPTSRLGSGLLTLGGVIVGCVMTYALTNRSSAAAVGAIEAPQAAASAPLPVEATRATSPAPAPVLSLEPAPAQSSLAAAPALASTEIAAPATSEIALDGVLVLPAGAARHRLFVDGKVVQVEDSRAVVPCGAHEIRIGSRGTPQTVDVACAGETTIPETQK